MELLSDVDLDYTEFEDDLVATRPIRRTFADNFTPEVNDEDFLRLRDKARKATTDFLDDCDLARARAKERDQAALRQIDNILVNPPPVATIMTRSRRRRSLGLPPPTVGDAIGLSAYSDMSAVSGRIAPRTVSEISAVPDRPTARHKMRHLESKLDGILDYELPSANSFKEMRTVLRGINDKMAAHRLLLDRYSAFNLAENPESVQDQIDAKVNELVPRMKSLSSVQHPYRQKADEEINEFDPRLVPGYSTGLSVTPNENNAELRGRIRNLLCRTRESSKGLGNNPHTRISAERRQGTTIE